MTAVTGPPGWWLASDGNWYPPYLHPDARAQVRVDGSEQPGLVTNSVGQAPPGSPPPGLPQFVPLSPSGQRSGPGSPGAYGYPNVPPSAPFGSGYGYGYGYGYPASRPSTNGLAIASLVLSIVCLLGIGSILGVIFGFVSRGQIARSNGTQRGSGLALSGIIVGFVTLSLVLLAIAIPTFLGVEQADSVTHLPPVPISLGSPVAGGQAGPMSWESKSQPVATTLTAVPGGVEMAIGDPAQSEWSGLPVAEGYQSIQISASVAIIAGDRSNGIGLGCITPTQGDQFAFLVRSSGLWQIALLTTTGAAILDQGSTSMIHSTGSNTLTIACDGDVARPDTTQVSFEVNGTPVANDVVAVASPQWIPTIQLCSCGGSDTGSFLNMGYYASAGPYITS